MRHRFFLLFSLSLTIAPWANASEIDRASIHDIQKAYWDSITTLELTGEEFVLDTSLSRKEGSRVFHDEFRIIYGSGGRMSFRRVQRGADGTHRGNRQFREDGNTTCGIQTFADDPDAVDQVLLMNQVSRPGHYEGDMCIALWAWMPGGKPIHVWLEEGASTTIGRNSDGHEVVVLSSSLRGRVLRVELDAEHEWLPKRVELVGSHTYVTRKFERDHGHWFPSDVVMLIDQASVPVGINTRSGFKLGTLAVNQPVPTRSFGMPEIPDGVLVLDQRKLKSNFFKGGSLARKKLEKAHEASAPPEPIAAQAASNVVAAPEQGRFPWLAGLVILSGILLILAWMLHRGS